MAHTFFWAGLDTGADTSRLSLIDEDLQPVLDVTLPSTPAAVAEALSAFDRSQIREIAAEATSASIHLARILRDQGYRIILYEVRQVSRYLRLRSNKTDNNDARGLAELAKLQLPSVKAVHLKSPDVQRLRLKLQLRRKMTVQRLQIENMAGAIFRLHGGKLISSRSKNGFGRNIGAALDEVRARIDVDLAPDVMPLLELSTTLRRIGRSLDDEFAAIAEDIPACALFLTIPGVGPICAVSFYTALEDPWRFDPVVAVGAYLGLTPRVLQSGSSLMHRRISKMGSNLTRSHLVNSATVMMRGKMELTSLKGWALSLAGRTGYRKARVALARRLAVIMLAMWRSGTSFDKNLPARLRRS